MRVYKRTIVWKWIDDNGVQSKFRIPNSYYVPEGKSRLLSPQHWASTQPKDTIQNGKWHSTTHADKCVLHYGKSKLTVSISKADNVATFYSTSGFNKIKEIQRQTLTTKRVQLMNHEEVELRCEVALTRNPSRRQWSLRSGLPISKRQAELEAKMQQQKSDQTRVDFSGLGGTNNLHHETQAEVKHSSLSNELLSYHKDSDTFHSTDYTRWLSKVSSQGDWSMQQNQHVLPAYTQRQPDGDGEEKDDKIGQTITESPHQVNAYQLINLSPQPPA